MDCAISTSTSTIRALQAPVDTSAPGVLSQPSSPRSSALPSPPGSPDSISSFPSLSSSFFFSSAAASPPHLHSHHDHSRDSTQGFIIPSLTLPSALHRPTTYGKTLGDVRLLVLSSDEASSSTLLSMILEGNEDIVDVSASESTEYGTITRASTDWIEHGDAHGLERFEPSHNVEILEIAGYSSREHFDVRYSLRRCWSCSHI